MRVLRAFAAYCRREKMTAGMLIFLAVILTWSAAVKGPAPQASPETAVTAASADTITPEKAPSFEKEAQEKIASLQKRPKVVAAIALVITGLLLAGFLIQIIFFSTLGPRMWTPGPMGASAWGVGDVFKAFIFLFFTECLISLSGGFFLGFFPDLPVNGNLLLMGTTFFRNAVTALFVLIYVRTRYGCGIATLGIHAREAGRWVGLGLAAYIAFLPVYFFLLLVLMGIVKQVGYEPPAQHVVEIMYQEQNPVTVIAFGIFIAFLGPVFEELFFRGFMYQAFRKKWGLLPGLVVTSLIFAVLHAHWIALAPIFVLSALLCFLFEKTGSIVPGMTLHVTHNLATLSLMLGVKYLQNG